MKKIRLETGETETETGKCKYSNSNCQLLAMNDERTVQSASGQPQPDWEQLSNTVTLT